MSSLGIRNEKIGDDYVDLEWHKHDGFVAIVNGIIVNYYGQDESVARKKFSSKLSYMRSQLRYNQTPYYLARKPWDEEDLGYISKNQIKTVTNNKPIKEITVLDWEYLRDKINLGDNRFWIVKTKDGKKIFVDTEGYDNPRYAAKIQS